MSKDLELGKLITGEKNRDAIHIAVAPVVAVERLTAGDHIGFVKGSMKEVIAMRVGAIGIVDPFLTTKVFRGDWFWMFLYPQTITSLRHDWTHPAFVENSAHIYSALDKAWEIGPSEKWLRAFAEEVGVSYETLLESAERYLASQEYYTIPNAQSTPECVYDKAPEMWKHYEIVTGIHPKVSPKETFFTCSC